MNKYRVYYTYTEPSCDCPEVLITGCYIDIKEVTHKAAKDYIAKDHYLNSMKENFKVIKSKLLEKDTHLLKRGLINNKKYIEGYSASFKLYDEEIVVTAKTVDNLQEVGVRLFGDKFILDTNQVRNVLITLNEESK